MKIKNSEKINSSSSSCSEEDRTIYLGTSRFKKLDKNSKSIEVSSVELLNQPKYEPLDMAEKSIKFPTFDEEKKFDGYNQ